MMKEFTAHFMFRDSNGTLQDEFLVLDVKNKTQGNKVAKEITKSNGWRFCQLIIEDLETV